MSRSKIFYSDAYKEIEKAIMKTLNEQQDFLSDATAGSTRAVGDAIQAIVAANFAEILGPLGADYSSEFARRAMADLAFADADGLYCVVDVKTHRIGTAFSMPNLISVERLATFYEDDKNVFAVLMVKYAVNGTKTDVREVRFVPIEFLDWGCLTVGALGWGQIQIANANSITIRDKFSRKKWMLELCDAMLSFYPKEVLKIEKRVIRFQKVKEFWSQKSDDPGA
ncbi:MAG: hypothetical protein K1X67_07205 [Fimbriimonadaceae bacterium]|nr:hypothetical protein [Fimbriimonadaceae bacterium]